MQAGNAEVEDLRLAVLVHQHVGRLQVAMHDPALVGEMRRARQLRQQADARAQVRLFAFQIAAQIRPTHHFQREPRRRQPAHRVLAGGVQAHDAGMLQLPQQRHFAAEALQRRG